MDLSAALLDLDGTIWDSYPWYAELLAREGRAQSRQVLSRLQSGHSIVSIVHDAGISRSRFSRLCEESASDLPVYPGVRDTLAALAARGVMLGVVTSLPGRLAEPMLRGAGLAAHFAAVVHAGNCRARKPSAGPILKALEFLGIETTSNVFYVGDRQIDARAASSAGVSFAWAAYGYEGEPPDRLDVTLNRFSDLLAE